VLRVGVEVDTSAVTEHEDPVATPIALLDLRVALIRRTALTRRTAFVTLRSTLLDGNILAGDGCGSSCQHNPKQYAKIHGEEVFSQTGYRSSVMGNTAF
jgi:hypothetical protein